MRIYLFISDSFFRQQPVGKAETWSLKLVGVLYFNSDNEGTQAEMPRRGLSHAST